MVAVTPSSFVERYSAMSHSHEPGHAASPFSPTEVENLHAEDVSAGTAIVGLMLTIFVLGVVGYLLVCWWVA